MPKAISDIVSFKGYRIYFWSDEGEPIEPVHIHFSKGRPQKNATKYWINKDGTIEQVNNNSRIPSKDLRDLEDIIMRYSDEIIKSWKSYFNVEPRYHKDVL